MDITKEQITYMNSISNPCNCVEYTSNSCSPDDIGLALWKLTFIIFTIISKFTVVFEEENEYMYSPSVI